jgi:Protein of unknown function (DUF1592)/Protein of unknown function (DUF1588)/Protein of unknown function (DUF1587)/Protein of unknown function (DUF1585)/Protein of unknown function (DUF1595)
MRFTLVLLIAASPLMRAAAGAGSFDKDVQPILRQTCSGCHNEKLASGGLNLTAFMEASSVIAKRDGWEQIVAKLKAGEMPPEGIPGPSAENMDALLKFVQDEFDKADKNAKVDPGRVTAHRLNRAEYSNTIRDLLGVDFRASEEFPADDSGYGFDNIGDVLTVSPALMQKYLSVAEKIAARAVGGDPLPKAGFFSNKERVRHLPGSCIEVTDILDYDADYIVRANLLGHRGAQGKPVTLVISVDGKPYKTVTVPVQISAVNQQGGATQRGFEEVRVFLTGNQHTFRAEFVDDEELAKIPQGARTNVNQNIFPETIEIAGPLPPAEPHPVQKKILLCDPASGSACVERILTSLTRHAYRRPVTKADVDGPARIFKQAVAAGYTPPQSLQFAVATVLVDPQFLFRLERDPKAGTSAPITDVELASRLSYFLWSSMPDDELLKLGEANRLHEPAVLDAQVKRLIADPKSSAFAENFAGQWLETRSLDAVKRDAKKFPAWNTELKEAMRTETRMFFEAVMRENLPASDFIDGKYTFVNELLARHYGMEGVTGSEFRRVELKGDERSGVFTQGSVLTVSAYPTRTSVVLRGKYLLENVLNAPPPPPPPDVPALNEAAVGVATSLRQQMETHRADALCASCHSKMDPLGFALENYDAIGKWRTEDGKFPVDSSGKFPNGKEFKGPAEMKTLLKDNMPEFTRCLTEKMLTYALGRGVESFDRLTVQALVRQTAQHDYKLQSLILGIVHSAPFQQRRGEPKPTAAKPTQEVAQK